MIVYEHPFNERIRTLLRLEYLFERFDYLIAQDSSICHHTAILTLFEISEVTGRADLKADLLIELEKQQQLLQNYQDNPHINQSALQLFLDKITQTRQKLRELHGKAGQHLIDNEWLSAIRSRAVIPGGTCRFDLPAYYAWQQLPAALRRNNLKTWIHPIETLKKAASILLEVIRESGQSLKTVAPKGYFQKMLSNKSYQLMQLKIPEDHIPEISANKYMVAIRFLTQDDHLRTSPFKEDVPFEITLC